MTPPANTTPACGLCVPMCVCTCTCTQRSIHFVPSHLQASQLWPSALADTLCAIVRHACATLPRRHMDVLCATVLGWERCGQQRCVLMSAWVAQMRSTPPWQNAHWRPACRQAAAAALSLRLMPLHWLQRVPCIAMATSCILLAAVLDAPFPLVVPFLPAFSRGRKITWAFCWHAPIACAASCQMMPPRQRLALLLQRCVHGLAAALPS